jgi:hypothetical protein
MKEFPVKILKPLEGKLNAMIFENSFLNLPKTLFFRIEIPLQAIDMSKIAEDITNKNYQTSFQLDWVKLNIRSLQDLENKTFTFPINPTNGYIDGSIYLFEVHNMIDTTNITFGKFNNQKIPIKTVLRIDFELEVTGYATTKFLDFETELNLGELSISTDILTPNTENFENAKALVAQFIEIESFDEPFVGEWGITFNMKNNDLFCKRNI